MARPVLVYTGPADALPAVQAGAGGVFEVVAVPPERGAIAAALTSATALLDASMKVRIDAAMIAASPHLRVITTATTGADHIDANALGSRGIPLMTLAGQTQVLSKLTAAAEHSWLLLMACARQLRAAVDHVVDGGWDRVQFPGVMLRNRRLGLIGCGRIGQCMARYGRAFEMDVVGVDPALAVLPDRIERIDLESLFETSDFISVHVQLNDATRGLVSADLLSRVRTGVIIVNTSRGEVVDEAALLQGLESGRVRAAGLDVLAGEPEIASHPLLEYARTHTNLIITPHIGGFSPDAVAVAVEFAARRAAIHLGSPA